MAPDEPQGRSRRRALHATAVGNVVEWYDIGLYGAFANAIAVSFFPGSAQERTVAVFAAFGVAFLVRPAGAVLFGHIGDKHGRRNTFAATLLVTSLATGAIGLLPGHQAIGSAAPALLFLLRVAQGLAIGGAYGGSTTFIVEHAPRDRRGAYGAVQWSTMALGLATGVATGALLNELLSERALEDWGWRVAFVAAMPLGLTSLLIRRRTEETPAFQALRVDSAARPVSPVSPVVETMRVARREVVLGLGLVASLSCAVNFFFVFLPNQLSRTGATSASRALAACVAGLLVVALVSPLAGSSSDRWGRRPVVLTGVILLLVAVGPACWFADELGSVGLVGAYTLVGLGLGVAAPSTFLAELFPTHLRYSGLSLTYGVGSAVVGAGTPLIATAVTGWGAAYLPMAAGMTTLLAGAVICILLTPETSPGPAHPSWVTTSSGRRRQDRHDRSPGTERTHEDR